LQLAHSSTHIIDLAPELKNFVSKALVYLMLKTDLAVAQVGHMASTLSEPAQVRLGEVGFDLSSATFGDKAPTLLGLKLTAFLSSLHPLSAVEEAPPSTSPSWTDPQLAASLSCLGLDPEIGHRLTALDEAVLRGKEHPAVQQWPQAGPS